MPMKIMADNTLSKKIHEWIPAGRRKRGRLKLSWIQVIAEIMRDRGLGNRAWGGAEINASVTLYRYYTDNVDWIICNK